MWTPPAAKKTPVDLYCCTICGAKCNYPSVLNDHMNKHTGARPYKCEKCGVSFQSITYYRSHLKTHEKNIISFLCDVCGKTFKNERYFRRHCADHTSPQVFSCDVCGTEFNRKSILKEHKKPSNRDDVINCEWCDCASGTYRCIEIHTKRYHAQLPTPPRPPTPQLSPETPLDPPVLRDPEYDTDLTLSSYYPPETGYDITAQQQPYTCEVIYRDMAPPSSHDMLQPNEHEGQPVYHTLSPVENPEQFMNEWFMDKPPATVTRPSSHDSSGSSNQPDHQKPSDSTPHDSNDSSGSSTSSATPQPLINNIVEAVETTDYLPYTCPQYPGHSDDCYICRFSHVSGVRDLFQ